MKHQCGLNKAGSSDNSVVRSLTGKYVKCAEGIGTDPRGASNCACQRRKGGMQNMPRRRQRVQQGCAKAENCGCQCTVGCNDVQTAAVQGECATVRAASGSLPRWQGHRRQAAQSSLPAAESSTCESALGCCGAGRLLAASVPGAWAHDSRSAWTWTWTWWHKHR